MQNWAQALYQPSETGKKVSDSDLFFTALTGPQIQVLSKKESLHLNGFFAKDPTWLKRYWSWKPPTYATWMAEPQNEEEDKGATKTSASFCSINGIKQNLSSEHFAPQAFSNLWQRCEKHFRTGHIDFLDQTISTLNIDFSQHEHPLARTVFFHLPNDIKVRALLFLKGPKKRPLIIIRSGIFSNLNTLSPDRYFFMQLFDEGPFHLLVLPSLSGQNFAQDNASYIFGGLEEGLHNLLIAELLQSPIEPLSQLVEKVHLLASSMGGQGALIAHLASDHFKSQFPERKQLIEKSLLFCPLMDLRSAENIHRKSKLNEAAFKLLIKRRLSVIEEKFQGQSTKQGIKAIIEEKIQNYHEPLVGWPAAERFGLREKDLRDLNFYQKNSPWHLFKESKSPMLIFYSNHDPLVAPNFNAKKIKDTQPFSQNDSLFLLPVNKSIHCALPKSYDYPKMSTFINLWFSHNKAQYEPPEDGGEPLAHHLSIALDKLTNGIDNNQTPWPNQMIKQKDAGLFAGPMNSYLAQLLSAQNLAKWAQGLSRMPFLQGPKEQEIDIKSKRHFRKILILDLKPIAQEQNLEVLAQVFYSGWPLEHCTNPLWQGFCVKHSLSFKLPSAAFDHSIYFSEWNDTMKESLMRWLQKEVNKLNF